ncbi:MAG: hypothetical protein GY950_30405 [bacterium]|nr:hypothetical protein [bacterium]
MYDRIEEELIRLTESAAMRREDLLLSGLRKSRKRKALNIAAGVLALISAGAITTVVADLFEEKRVQQIIAALVAGLSGMISIIISAYFNDDEILSMLTGSSKYLALRESVYRLVIDPSISNEERFQILSQLQDEYSKLDETYSRYFSLNTALFSKLLLLGKNRDRSRAHQAANDDISLLYRKIKERQLADEPKKANGADETDVQ